MTEQEWLGNNQLSLDIWNNKYRNQTKDESFEQWLDRVSGNNSEIKRLIREKKFLFGGRTLANRGIPNSGSFSNCYSIGYVPDSLDGIMDVAHKIAMTFKAQGGQGRRLRHILCGPRSLRRGLHLRGREPQQAGVENAEGHRRRRLRLVQGQGHREGAQRIPRREADGPHSLQGRGRIKKRMARGRLPGSHQKATTARRKPLF